MKDHNRTQNEVSCTCLSLSRLRLQEDESLVIFTDGRMQMKHCEVFEAKERYESQCASVGRCELT